MSDRAPCRICGQRVYHRFDNIVSPHEANGAICPGTRRPPEGEPPCSVYCCRDAGFVCWPTNPADIENNAHASTLVCANPQHQAEAIEWVRAITGHPGVFLTIEEMHQMASAQ